MILLLYSYHKQQLEWTWLCCRQAVTDVAVSETWHCHRQTSSAVARVSSLFPLLWLVTYYPIIYVRVIVLACIVEGWND